MFSIPLLKRELKSNYKIFVIIACVLVFYVSVIISMFDPEMGKMLKEFEAAMPGLMSAVGMSGVGDSMIEFAASYLYGFLLIVFPMIFEIILANRLIARYVDSGSMAYLLATPNKRKKLALTQAVFLAGNIALLVLFVAVFGIIFSEILFPGQLDISKFLLMNISLYGLHIIISGLGFFASCISNDMKLSYSISAGVPIAFYIIQMMANMGGKLENLKYATFYTLFDTKKIIFDGSSAIFMTIIMYAAGILFYGIGIAKFAKRDLPL